MLPCRRRHRPRRPRRRRRRHAHDLGTGAVTEVGGHHVEDAGALGGAQQLAEAAEALLLGRGLGDAQPAA
jgi:hypothetical protein